MTVVSFILPGHPQGKGRARAFIRGGHIAMVTPDKTRSYEGMIRDAAAQAMEGRALFEGPVSLTITAIFDVPASWSRKKREAAIDGQMVPTKKPDLSNVLKAFEDACNGVVFKDDAQITRLKLSKIYGVKPAVVMHVEAVS